MDRCVAWLTYAAPRPIDPALWSRMGPWVYGCDACQEACPLNRGRWEDREPMPWMAAIEKRLRPDRLAGMTDEEYRAHIHPRFWYIAAQDAERWRENARRALAAGETAPRA